MRNIFKKNKNNPVKLTEDNQIQEPIVINRDSMLNDKLKESEIRYRRLFETAKDGILILDFETGNIIDANPFIVKIIDYPLDEILGKKLWEIGLFRDKEESELAFFELKTNGYIRFEDMPIKRRNGKIKQVEYISNVYEENNAKVIQCNIRDISERKLIERKQELNTKILYILNSQGNWKELINNILIEIKKFTGIEAVGIRLKEDEDYPYFEAMGFPDYFLQAKRYLRKRDPKGKVVSDEKESAELECMCHNVISGKIDISLSCFTKGGSYYINHISPLQDDAEEKEKQNLICNECSIKGYESVALIPIFSGQEIIGLLQMNDKKSDIFSLDMIMFLEKTVNTIGIAFSRIQNEKKIKESEQRLKTQNIEYHDLNEKYLSLNKKLTESLDHLQMMNDELIVSKAKAEESDKLKSVFLANMSHEIRSPMNVIMGYSDLLLQPELSKEKLQSYVQIINASSIQLMSVISDIIDISKIEIGQLTIESEFVDINDLLRGIYVTYSKLIENNKFSLICSREFPDDFIQIKSDGSRIRQVFCNLLNNAIKFTKEGNIEFGYKIKDHFIEFYVKDSGIGISPENQLVIFERFRQVETSETRNYEGNGLGLAISKALVEKLGGNISVASELHNGSTFTFTIPYLKSSDNTTTSDLKIKPEKILNWSDKTILIVEDDIDNHNYINEILTNTRVKVLHAWNGMEAVDQVMNHHDISIVLMDFKMAIMDGYEATRLIRQIRPKLPIIAQTAYALGNDKRKALEAGCDDYIAKPIKLEQLIQLLKRYMS